MLRVNARARVLATLLLSFGLAGCQLIVDFDRSRIVETDAGGGGMDGGGTDAGMADAGSDAGMDDAGMDDGGMDDAGTDAGMADAGTDAGMADAGTDAGMTCGNNMVEGTETCDDGNTDVEECPYGTASCTVCGATCTMVSSTGPVCGDSMVEAGEETCDDGNAVTEECPYGTASCMVCGDACSMVSSTGPVCGDSMVEAGEETCDDGASNGTYGSCNATCTDVLECGDGIVNGPEDCEPPSTATCDASCVTIP